MSLAPEQLTILRGLITEAVQREVDTQIALAVRREALEHIAPLREQVQILRGIVSQLQEDYRLMQQEYTALTQVIYGEPKLGIIGLMPQVKRLVESLDNWSNQLKGAKITVGALTVLTSVDLLRFVYSILNGV
jgi:hypothetical protein